MHFPIALFGKFMRLWQMCLDAILTDEIKVVTRTKGNYGTDNKIKKQFHSEKFGNFPSSNVLLH